MKIRLFGLQRSGTTYIEYLLINNYKCSISGRENSNKHKHSYDVAGDEDIRLHIVRNPLTWVVSFHKFKERFTWYSKTLTYENLLTIYADIYNKMNEDWLNNCDATIKYEDSKEKFDFLKLKRKTVKWIDTDLHIHMQPTPTKQKFVGSVYLKEGKDIFLSLLNKDLLKELKYDCR